MQESQGPDSLVQEEGDAEYEQLVQKVAMKLQEKQNSGVTLNLENLVAMMSSPIADKHNNNIIGRQDNAVTPKLILQRILDADDVSGNPPVARPQQVRLPQVSVSNADKQKFKTQLRRLADMGFENEEQNLQMLKRTNGDVNAAVDLLCSIES